MDFELSGPSCLVNCAQNCYDEGIRPKLYLQTSRYEELHQTQAIKLKKANEIHLMIQRPTSF